MKAHGSANFVQTLLKHDLVDAFWLKIFPITLGGGKRLFADGTIPASICEEAFEKLTERGIQAFAGHKHVRAERPLHAESPVFSEDERKRVAAVCKGINKFGLGFQDLATMVVLYRNAPNSVPVLLRGNVNQAPFFGIFPRWMDLPVRHI
jgi:hypothetical protein